MATQQSRSRLPAELFTRSLPFLFQNKSRIKDLTLGVIHFSFLATEGRSVRASGLLRAGSRTQCSWKSKASLLPLRLCPRARLRKFRKYYYRRPQRKLWKPRNEATENQNTKTTKHQRKKSGSAPGICGSYRRIQQAAARFEALIAQFLELCLA